MDPNFRELLDLLVRWVHVIAGIMWIGNSMLFNWLDRNLVRPEGANERMIGEMWMLHSGGFYQVEKKYLAPDEMPAVLHWFKWQSYTTWLSGFSLLAIVYYMSNGAFLVDPSVYDISPGAATALGIGVLAGAWAVYDLLWRSPIGTRAPQVAVALSFLFAAAVAFLLLHVFSARAAYIHIGAMLGTVMAGNVFFHIIPSQKQMVAATKAGQMADPKLGAAAKRRSIHNNYITFPVIFIMVSNHFPSTYGNRLNWLVLAVLILGGATVRHFMNIRFTFQRWLPALLTTVALTVGALILLMAPPSSAKDTAKVEATTAVPTAEHVAFPVVEAVIHQRCISCHAAKPTDAIFTTAPAGVMLDAPDRIKAYAPRIKVRAVETKTMPFGNKTGITQQERDLLGRWIDEGAALN